MQFYSTNGQSSPADLKEAVLRSLPSDNGLYMPENLGTLPESFFKRLPDYSFPEMAFEVAKTLLADSLPESVLEEIVHDAVNFPAPIHELDDRLACLELFHGPSLAFKDFGARFMSRTMSHFVADSKSKLHILVATSGDTGGAVAMGFYDAPNIDVTILYPSGKVSDLQELQLTTLGKNIKAIEVDGVFDDCQALVKQAFLDEDLRSKLQLSSANSINIARLIPQSFYYFEAYRQIQKKNRPIVFCTPSGNFGNITAGLMAKRIGLPVEKFVAANNSNNVFTKYLNTGEYNPGPSVATISNAMDVGAPSNFVRILDLYDAKLENLKKDMLAYSYDDELTKGAIAELENQYGYTACPHTAVAYLGIKEYFKQHPDSEAIGVFLGTAHAAKFLDVVESASGKKVAIPPALEELRSRKKEAIQMGTDYDTFREYLMTLV